jgi:hypothetical protein
MSPSIRIFSAFVRDSESAEIRSEDGKIGLLFAYRDEKRFRIIDKLAQFSESGTTSSRRSRRHERTPANAFGCFTCADGYLVQCHILDISRKGMSVRVLVRPPIGEIVSFGGTYRRVTRHHDQGVVIQFVEDSAEQLIAASAHNYQSPDGPGLSP